MWPIGEDAVHSAVSKHLASLARTSSQHYEVNTGLTPPAPYVQRYSGPRHVVTREYHDNGIGGTRSFRHYYNTAFVDRSGRGWLSFNHHIVFDEQRGTNTATWFNQAWPFIGRVELVRERRTSGNFTIREVDPVLAATELGSTTPKRYFVRTEQTTTKEYEVEGSAHGTHLRTIVDDPAYNSTYGYVTSRTTTLTDPQTAQTWTTAVTTNATADTTNWCLGLPGLVETTRTAPGMAAETRRLRHTWNSTNCSLTETRDESESSTALQLKTSYTYSGRGNPTAVTQTNVAGTAQSRTTSYAYDTWGQYPTTVTIGTVNLTTTHTWNYVAGQPASTTGPDGLTTSFTYDAFGRLASETVPGHTTTLSYVACGSCFPNHAFYYVRAQGNDGSDTYQYFDRRNRPVGSAWLAPGGVEAREETRYTALGEVDRVTQPRLWNEPTYWVTYTYDLIGRVLTENAPISESTPTGAITTYQHLGHEVWITNPKNQTTKTRHNAAGHVVQVTDPLNGSATYTYRSFGELATLTDAESHTTTLGYDARGLRTSINDPSLGSWTYAYSVFGELTSQTNALSQTTTLAYDAGGRLTTRTEPEGATTYSYYTSGTGAKGRLHTVSGPGHSVYRTYHSTFGTPTLVRETLDSTQYDFDLSYDGQGRLNRLTYPTSTSGYRFKADYIFDNWGHLEEVRDGNNSSLYYRIDAADALGRPLNAALGNGLNEYYNYDRAAGYLKTIETDPGLGSSVQDLSFTYDQVGNVLTRTDHQISRTETFTYDALNRLTQSVVGGQSAVTVSYSATGRITNKSDVGNYTYGSGGAPPQAVTSAGSTSYSYDAQGRMTSRAGSTITWTSYDLPKVINSGSQSTEFWYGVGRARYKQAQKTGGSTDATILYVGQLLEKETRGSTTTWRHYVQAGSRTVAMMERENTTNTTRYLHRDHQGSVVKVTDASGAAIDTLAFDAWGLRRNASTWAPLGSPFGGTQLTERGYTGHEHLDTVGLIHMNGRVQDPKIGRFLSPDPLVQAPYHTQSHNRYSYVWNNPVTLIDPSGFQTRGPWPVEDIPGVVNLWDYAWRHSPDDNATSGDSHEWAWLMTILFSAQNQQMDEEAYRLAAPDGFHGLAPQGGAPSAGAGPSLWQRINPFSEYNWNRNWETISSCSGCDPSIPLSDNDRVLIGQFEQLTIWSIGGAGGVGGSVVVGAGTRGAASGGSGGFNALQKLFEIQRGRGNFGVGQLTVGQADEIGRAFVGPNAVNVIKSGQVIGIRSQDGLRVFRFPSQKAGGQAAGRVQANIEEFFINAAGGKVQIRNAHIDIIP